MSKTTDKKIKKYKKDVKDQAEERSKSIKNSLSKIYQDENGDIINVKEVKIKKGKGKSFWALSFVFYLILIAAIFYGIYYYINKDLDTSNIDFLIESENKQVSGQEFFSVVKYQNLDRVDMEDVQIQLDYPKNFIFIESVPNPDEGNNIWQIDTLASHRGGEIKIKGKIVDETDESNLIIGEMIYTPKNFSSEFKETTSTEIITHDSGLNMEIINPVSMLVDEEEDLTIKFNLKEIKGIDNFKLTVTPTNTDNIIFVKSSLAELEDNVENVKEITPIEPWVWEINDINKNEQTLNIKFKVKDRLTDKENFTLNFEYKNEILVKGDDEDKEDEELEEETITAEQVEAIMKNTEKEDTEIVSIYKNKEYYLFFKKEFDIEIIKNDLNLSLIINDNNTNQSIDFGQKLDYTINYSNKGDSDMKNIIIMAVLEGDLINWDSINTSSGIVKGNTITWTPNELENLKVLTKQSKGNINFSVTTKTIDQITDKNINEIKSYAQFNTFREDEGGEAVVIEENNNVSNIITNKVNSDLSLTEQLRYYTVDNMPVGTGPLPPKVNNKTTLKGYWTINNTMHGLRNIQVVTDLPDYVKWDGKESTTTGRIQYDQYDHRIIWEIDDLTIYDDAPTAEFSIGIKPRYEDENRILILLNNTKIVAKDIETSNQITKINKAKTTKLDDDDMIPNDGVIRAE